MLLHYYTHSILFWLGLPKFKPYEDFAQNLQSLDLDYLPREVCIAQCLQRKKEAQMSPVLEQQVQPLEVINNTSLQICLDNCITTNSTHETNGTSSTVKQIHENYSLNLICRDESSLHFLIDLHTMSKGEKSKTKKVPDITASSYEISTTPSSPAAGLTSSLSSSSYEDDSNSSENEYETLFVIKIHQANDAEEIFAYLSDDTFFTIDQLMANKTYNISVIAVHSNNKYSVITQQQQFQTLRRSYTPGNVTEIKIINFSEDKGDKMHLTATMTWKPPADMTCHYDIICFSPEREDYDLPAFEIRNPRQLYKYQLENLTFSSVYKVGIRARNTKNMKESELFWKTFQAPSCVEWHNYNFNVCAPDAPQNLHIEQTYVDQNMYSFNITWLLPSHLPDNYTLRIQDLSPQGQLKIYNLTKEMHNIFLPHVAIYGVFYEVSLTAYTKGGQTTSSYTDFTKTIVHMSEKNPFVKLIAIILAPIFCVAILSLTIFMIYHRKAKLERYQQRCKYFEELEKKAPIDPKDNFEFNSNNKHKSDELQYQLDADDMTLINDEMEIDRNQLSLHEILGEGAFGLVKRGIYKNPKLSIAHEVAVKMLKDHPSTDELRAFRREIEVMKSVEKHPNIVGIIGHCTRNGSEMMLLTEYCSFGNLLNFLRDEWRFLHELQQQKQTLSTRIVDAKLPRVHDKQTNELHFQYAKNHKLSSPYAMNGVSIQTNNNKNDDAGGYLKTDDDDDVVARFKKKYNDFNVTTASATAITNYVINKNNNKNIKLHKLKENLQHIVDANASTTQLTNITSSYHITLNDGTILAQVANDQQTITTTATSPATENKSYGYHGCCTNSCKCNVDVIIRNIDAFDSTKDNDDLDRLLRQQQQFPEKQKPSTIEIKNCNCKMNEQNFHCLNNQQTPPNDSNKCNSAVENKTYFKIFNSDKYLTLKQRLMDASQKSTQALAAAPLATTKVKTKTKPPPLRPLALAIPAATPMSDANMGVETFNRVPLSAGDLLDIARQVAVGMDFLAKNKVVHRDLAARNVLVAPDRTIKIADFGLSRDVYQENMYKKTGNGKLPIKWLALESMTHQVYTTQSDVWSYGILLYEIVTLGATPYPSIPTNRLLHLLKSGYRMEKPKNCDQEFYDLMNACWNGLPNDRPPFSEIIKKLDDMLNNLNNATSTGIPIDRDCIKEDNDLSKLESPIQQIYSDDSYLKPLENVTTH